MLSARRAVVDTDFQHNIFFDGERFNVLRQFQKQIRAVQIGESNLQGSDSGTWKYARRRDGAENRAKQK